MTACTSCGGAGYVPGDRPLEPRRRCPACSVCTSCGHTLGAHVEALHSAGGTSPARCDGPGEVPADRPDAKPSPCPCTAFRARRA